MNMMNNPVFLQAAGNTGSEGIIMQFTEIGERTGGRFIQLVGRVGGVIDVKYIHEGEIINETYPFPAPDPESESQESVLELYLYDADPETNVRILGDVEALRQTDAGDDGIKSIKGHLRSLKEIMLVWMSDFNEINVSGFKNLEALYLKCYSSCELNTINIQDNISISRLGLLNLKNFNSLDIQHNVNIQRLNIENLPKIKSISLLKNVNINEILLEDLPELEHLTLVGFENNQVNDFSTPNFPMLSTIKTLGVNFGNMNFVENAISNSEMDNGTVYVPTDAPEYVGIHTAATERGWSVEPLQA